MRTAAVCGVTKNAGKRKDTNDTEIEIGSDDEAEEQEEKEEEEKEEERVWLSWKR